MQFRSRIPTIFTLYMVDVLCCALGCIILLWLVNARVANRRALAASESGKQLSATKSTLDATLVSLASLRSLHAASEDREHLTNERLKQTRLEREHLVQLALLLQNKHKDTAKTLELSQQQLAALLKDLQTLQLAKVALQAGLDSKTKEFASLSAQLTAAAELIKGLDKQLLEKARQLAADAKKIEGLGSKLTLSDARIKELEKLEMSLRLLAQDYRDQSTAALDRSKVLQKNLDQHKTQLMDAGKLAQELFEVKQKLEQLLALREKELAAAGRVLGGLRVENQTLADQIRLLRFDADSRFAGISLTGERVLFVVDISGSMRMRDPDTIDNSKWPLVCEELGKLMRSIPGLRKYQILVFSDKVAYPLGSRRQWLDFDPKISAVSAVDVLKRITPDGGTNISAALSEAFGFRQDGLDTIYFLSDGLPNDGDTLTNPRTGFTEQKTPAALAKYIRHTLQTSWNRPRFRWLGRPVTLNTIGFFFESPDVGAFLWALARENHGSFVGMSRP